MGISFKSDDKMRTKSVTISNWHWKKAWSIML